MRTSIQNPTDLSGQPRNRTGKYFLLFFTILLITAFGSVQLNGQSGENVNPPPVETIINQDQGDLQQIPKEEKCGFVEVEKMLQQKYPNRLTEEQFEQWMQQKIANGEIRSTRAVTVIPVVVHVIHNGETVGTGTNISVAQVMSQIDVLNEDFRRLNADASNTPDDFDPVASDPEIEFSLATVTPEGKTGQYAGIHRYNGCQDSYSKADIENNIKPATAWNPEYYFNIWVAPLQGGLLGYAQFPSVSGLAGLDANGGEAETDGIVIRSTAFGNTGTAAAPFDLGRTATHEAGHFFGLRHIWGDGNCAVDDHVGDTPTQSGSNTTSNPCTYPGRNSCVDAGTDLPDMFMNFMDYSDDECMNLFTGGQKTRFDAVLENSPRRNFENSQVINGVKPPKWGNPDVQVALVLDRSGSMGSYGYMTAAKNAAKSFVGLMNITDWLAITSFSNYASVNFPFAQITCEEIKNDAISKINTINAGGTTSIGAGLQAAQNQLYQGNTDETQGMVLLSDGYENRSPYVSQVLPTIPAKTDIYTIALGPNSDQNLLNNIASATGGFYSYAPNTQRLTLIYNSIRAKVTGQQLLAIFYGLIGQGQYRTHTVSVDAGITFANFSVTWPGSDLDLELTDPSGNVIDHSVTDPNISFTSGNTFENYGVLNPEAGEWTLKIIGVQVSGNTEYTASVTGQSSLTMDIDFNKSIYGLNESILVTAELIDGVDPVTGANVTADVTNPARMNLMITQEEGDEPEEGVELFYEEIDETKGRYHDNESSTYYNVNVDVMILYDDGQHGDGAANDGIYGNYYTNTGKTGSYTFDVTATGTGPNSGAFVRTLSKSTTVTTTKSISVTEPQTGTEFYAECYHTVRWSSTNITGNVNIYLSTDGGSTYTSLASNIDDDGTEDLMMPDLSSTSCRIKVQSIDYTAISGLNPGLFSIVTVGDAGAILGTSSVNQGQNSVAYSISAVPNAMDYTWDYSGTGATINGTSNNITIDFAANATSGNLTVKAANACAADAWSPDFPITVVSVGGGGDTEFTDSGQYLGSAFNTFVALGDVDGDGDLDAVVTNDQASQANKVWLNDGAANFTDGYMDFGGNESWGVALYDFDGDGDLDAFIANNGPNKVYLNNGSGFTSNGQNLGNLPSSDVALADLDGDGDMDAAVANNTNGYPNKIWLNNGNAIFFDPGLSLGNAKSYGLALGDLDGDGDPDGFIANEGPNKVYLNNGSGTSDNGQNLGNDNSKAVGLGDMDGDGDLDAVVANNSSGQPNRVWLNDGDGDFTDSGLNFGSNISMDLALGDLDGDGDLDGFVANNGANKVYLNDGMATTDNGQNLGTGNSYAVALGDLDGDGDLDAFVANYDGPNKVWLNQTNGTTGNSQRPVAETQDGEQEDARTGSEIIFAGEVAQEVDYMLYNYPDPFADNTTIKFMVNTSEMTTLKIYNMYGGEVAVLFNGMSHAGNEYQFTFNAQLLPKGIYILHLQVGNSISVKEKMMLIK